MSPLIYPYNTTTMYFFKITIYTNKIITYSKTYTDYDSYLDELSGYDVIYIQSVKRISNKAYMEIKNNKITFFKTILQDNDVTIMFEIGLKNTILPENYEHIKEELLNL